MKSALFSLALLLGPVSALKVPATTRANFLKSAAAAASLVPGAALAASASWDPHRDFLVGPEKNAISDFEVVATQQAGAGRIDVNNALVTDYKTLPGMYPHAAGLIASNGPYNTVQDLMKIPQATSRDKELFTKYRAELIALPPGRQFYERINACAPPVWTRALWAPARGGPSSNARVTASTLHSRTLDLSRARLASGRRQST